MLRKYLNVDEFKLANEIGLLLRFRLRMLFTRRLPTDSNRILIIDTCIIGDFIGTLPALRTYIRQHAPQMVDLIVSPAVRSIAESIIGVCTVYTARSVYQRKNEPPPERTSLPRNYQHVLVLRISSDAYRMLSGIRSADIITYDVHFYRYFFHIFRTTLHKQQVRQWRDVNYDIIGVAPPATPLTFMDIFSIDHAELERVSRLRELRGHRRHILIHTGSGWHIKLWENARWTEAIRKINQLGEFDFIFVGGGELEARSFDEIQRLLDFQIHSLINKIDLRTTLLVMRLSSYFIGIDSGPRNMAHLADLRSVSLLGPAPKNFLPTNNSDVVIDKFTCRCKSLFYFHNVSAMASLQADDVVDAFKQLLASTAHKGQQAHTQRVA